MGDRTGHWTNRTVLAGLAVLSVAACSPAASSTSGSVAAKAADTQVQSTASPVQLVDVVKGAALAADPSVIVIDVRTPAEFAEGHIARAEVVDVSAVDFGARIAQFDRSRSYLVYCHSGRRSSQATAMMAELGFANVYNLDGGITAWQSAGAPVVT